MGDVVRVLIVGAQTALATVEVALSLIARVGASVYAAATGMLAELGVEVVLPLVALANILR